jgi:8-oxo-dGTP pyrophosphatase MutT (NUDIX family)
MKKTQNINDVMRNEKSYENEQYDIDGTSGEFYADMNYDSNKFRKNYNLHKSQSYPKDIICSNCRKMGHYQRNCKKPIQSFGIIAVQIGNPLKYLMIRRRNSIGYETFLRGRYDNDDQMYKLIDRMTTQEKEKILTTDFDALWDDLCVIRDSKFYKYGKIRAKEKFENQNIKDLFKDTSSIWDLPSWGFPKGRRYSQKETDIQCATREFIEETNLDREHFRIIFTKPYMEVYTGTNDVRYKHIYYIAIVSKDAPLPIIDPLNQYQCAEIGDIGWFTLEDALELIKPYNEEKKVVLRQADALLKNYVY